MMKIGVSMLGKSVVCPDCRNRIEVPFESDPRAETLYRRMKQQKPDQATSASDSSAHSESSVRQTFSKPQSRFDLPPSSAPTPAGVGTHGDSLPIETEQVDDWIERLWTDVPDSGVVVESRRYHARKQDMEEGPKENPNISSTVRSIWNDSSLFQLTATCLVVIFLIGVSCGFFLRPLIAPNRMTAGNSGTSDDARTGRRLAVEGKLTFETPEEKLMPDADAVVIFLPTIRSPVVPLNSRGLRPEDGTETEKSEPSDAVQQIEELGGKYLRTDADGKFSLTVDAGGRYLGILISSHTIRPAEVKWNAETDRNLRRFFREPSELLGNYRFLCEEYDIKKGETLSVQYNFSR